MLEIETLITGLMPEAQRRVIDWIRARWLDTTPGTTSELSLAGLDELEGLSELGRHGLDPMLSTMGFGDGGVVVGGEGDEVVGGVFSADEDLNDANALLDEADWASTLLARLRSYNAYEIVSALQEAEQPEVMERLLAVLDSATVSSAIDAARSRWPDGAAGKAIPVGT